jgi:sugar lactone lactonase YvrE
VTGRLNFTTLWQPVVYEVTDAGTIRRVAGTGEVGFAGDGGPALDAKFHWPTSIEFDAKGNLYVADFFNDRIRKIAPDGAITTFAGTGERGYGGDGGPAGLASFYGPNDLVIDSKGNVYVADVNNHRVRKISAEPPHTVTTLAGTGTRGYSGDGGPATQAQLNLPRGLALSPDESTLYVTDSLNGRVRAISLSK